MIKKIRDLRDIYAICTIGVDAFTENLPGDMFDQGILTARRSQFIEAATSFLWKVCRMYSSDQDFIDNWNYIIGAIPDENDAEDDDETEQDKARTMRAEYEESMGRGRA